MWFRWSGEARRDRSGVVGVTVACSNVRFEIVERTGGRATSGTGRTGLGAEGAAKQTCNHRIDSQDEPEQDQPSEDEKPHSEGREGDSAA